MENKDLIVELTDAEGEIVKVQIVGHFTDNGKDYVIANDLSNDEDAYILEVKTNGETSELVSIDNCLLLRDEINKIIPNLKELVKEKDNNIEDIVVRVANDTSDLMVNIIGKVDNLFSLKSLVNTIYVILLYQVLVNINS